jgi:hypothetical protein
MALRQKHFVSSTAGVALVLGRVGGGGTGELGCGWVWLSILFWLFGVLGVYLRVCLLVCIWFLVGVYLLYSCSRHCVVGFWFF